MSDQMIHDEGKDTMVREDTAKAFRWNKFIGIILAGIVLLLILGILLFSGTFSAIQPNMNPSNTAPNQNRGI
jgi:hypothetical protein